MENKEEGNGKQIKEKIIDWLKNPYNLVLVFIFLGIILVRFYFYYLSRNQPLWWDESQYMSLAKTIAGQAKYQLTGPRTQFFSMAMSIFFFTGLSYEPFMRFVALLIPSLIIILLVYLTINEMYPDKKIALISTAIAGVLWEHLFYSNRFQTENPSLIFQLLGLFILFKCYIKKENFYFIKSKYSLLWVILFTFIAILLRAGTIVALPAIVLFVLILEKDKLFTKKGIIYSAIAVILMITASYFLINSSLAKPYLEVFYKPDNPIAWPVLSIFNGFYDSVVPNLPGILFYCFIAGFIIYIIELVMGFERIKNLKADKENLSEKSDLFSFILVISVIFIFTFIMRTSTIEYRWFFPLLVGMLAFTGEGVIKLPKYILSFLGLKNKNVLIAIIIIITIFGVYNQYMHADMIIKNKLASYQQVKDSGLWLKQNTDANDIIISASEPQHSYYSERKVMGFTGIDGIFNVTDFENKVKTLHPKYIVLSIFQPVDSQVYTWPQMHNDTVIPVKEYMLDENQNQPALVIYEVSRDFGKSPILNITKDDKN